MQAINPFLVLDVDEAASRDEIETAYRQLARAWHPDRYASCSPEEQQAASERMAEITYAYELLTDPAVARAHRSRMDRVRAAGVDVGRAPQRQPGTERPAAEPDRAYRTAAAREFTVGRSTTGTPWTGRRSKGWFRPR